MKKRIIYLSMAAVVALTGVKTYLDSDKQEVARAQNEEEYLEASSRVLTWGSSGEEVRTVQTKLQQWGFHSGAIDGIYGPDTYRAVRRFQRHHGIKEDGIVGGVTAGKIGITLGGATRASTNSPINREDDVYLLARAVHGEARGEPYIGKVAVAAVVLNRVRASEFPNTIAGVIYQPLAFTAVADGQINLEPDEESMRAARDALNGWDPSYGCLYYWNPITSTSKWIWSRTVSIKIGKHWFGN